MWRYIVESEYSCAIFNEDRTHRFGLYRKFPTGHGSLCIVTLHPGSGDREKEDAISQLCTDIAIHYGYRWLWNANIYSFIAEDTQELKDCGYPVDTMNDAWVRSMVHAADNTLCAWGEDALPEDVQGIFSGIKGKDLNCFWHPGGKIEPAYIRDVQRPYTIKKFAVS